MNAARLNDGTAIDRPSLRHTTPRRVPKVVIHMANTQCRWALQQIDFARQYTQPFFEDVQDQEWFAMPHGAQSHLAWQMGHLAMAEYALALVRIRGREKEDNEFISKNFFRAFQKGTTPTPDPADYPSVAEIRETFDAVHQRVMSEAAGFVDEQLLDPLPAPYAVHPNKLGSLLFCSAHEMLHGGQIGMLRRMLGREPLR